MCGTVITRVALAGSLTACAGTPHQAAAPAEPPAEGRMLFAAETAIQDQWQHVSLRGVTEYRLAVVDGRLAIRATGQNSASALVRAVEVDPVRCPWLEWSWRVERMPREADIPLREREDVAASLFLFFGDPGLGLLDWKPVPTLRYAWAAERVPIETVVDSPYLPGTVRTLVVESGEARLGRWLTARRVPSARRDDR